MLQTLISLFWSFFKIGCFGFGGGYAMITLIEEELQSHTWLSLKEFIDIIAIAEMTPGPIAINSGTFVGFKIALIPGALVATLGVVLPSFILVSILAYYFKKVKEVGFIDQILRCLRPVVIGLIFAAAFSISKSSYVDWKSIVIGLVVFGVMIKVKISPIVVIVLAGISGVLLY